MPQSVRLASAASGGENGSHALVEAGRHVRREERHERVDDDQIGVRLPDVGFEFVQISREENRVGVLVLAPPDDAQAVEVGPGGDGPRASGVGGRVFGIQHQDGVRATGRLTVGQRLAAGESGGQVDGDERLAHLGVAVEQGDFAAGEERLPQPAEVTDPDLGERGDGATLHDETSERRCVQAYTCVVSGVKHRRRGYV